MSLDEFDVAEAECPPLYELDRGVIAYRDVQPISHALSVDVVRREVDPARGSASSRIRFIARAGMAKVMCERYQSERHPDLMIYCSPPPNEMPWDVWTPEVIVEVVSETSRRRDYVRTPPEYLAIGVMEYWIIDPIAGFATFKTRWRGKWRDNPLRAGQSYSTHLLPGLKLDVRKLLNAGR